MLGFTLAFMASAIGVSPTLAGTPPDSGSKVTCNYRTKSPGPAFTAKLRTIVVKPPEVFAKSGTQTVGWRFSVRRTIDEGDYPTHEVTYVSPTQKAEATTSTAAAFTTKSVSVGLPTVEDLRDVYYEIVIKMTWYRADGSVKSATSFLMSTYWAHVQGDGWKYTEGYLDNCGAVQWAAV
jgi:hypothetical protein